MQIFSLRRQRWRATDRRMQLRCWSTSRRSIRAVCFIPNAPLLESQAYLDLHDAGNALRVLTPLQNTPAAGRSDFRLALGKVYQASGNAAQALAFYRQIYLGDPLSPEATSAKIQLAAMNAPLAPAERKQHADAMFNAKQYAVAAEEYRALQKNEKQLTQADRDALEIYAAVCDLRLKKLSRTDVSRLPVTGDDSAALKLYLESELAREGGNTGEHDQNCPGNVKDYSQSRWLEEALYSGGNMYLSGGNMYLLKKDYPKAITEYEDLTQHFPHSTYAPSAHWRAAWLNYRMRHYPDAARLMDEQIVNYPAGTEVPGALYWRARLYEDIEHKPATSAQLLPGAERSLMRTPITRCWEGSASLSSGATKPLNPRQYWRQCILSRTRN